MGCFLCHQREKGRQRQRNGESERLCLLHLLLLATICLAVNIRLRLGTLQLCCISPHVLLITNIRRHCQHIDSLIPRSVWAIDGLSRLETPNPKNANVFLFLLSISCDSLTCLIVAPVNTASNMLNQMSCD